MIQPTVSESSYYAIVLILFSFMCTTSSIGQTWDEVIKLTASDATADDQFGVSVSISGDKAIVGAHNNSDDGESSGAAYIYEFVDGEWMETQKLTASDAAADDAFGFSVGIFGDRAIVGVPHSSGDGFYSGAAYIFELIGDTWVEIEKLTASDVTAGDQFGWSVAISTDRIIVGAYLHDGPGLGSGAAYIFELVDDAWVETQELTAADGTGNEGFGRSVALSGERAIIGSYTDDDDGTNSGSAYIFELVDDEWEEVQKLTASDPSDYDLFGTSVSIFDDRAVVGAHWNDVYYTDCGSAYIFELVDDEWVETQKLVASDTSAFVSFGCSVSISGNTVVVGAYNNDDDGLSSGAAYIFDLVDETWVEIEKITASDAEEEDLFGLRVSISGNRAIVGAYNNDDDGLSSGSAYIFEKCWTLPQ